MTINVTSQCDTSFAVPEFRPFASSPQFDVYFEYVSQ